MEVNYLFCFILFTMFYNLAATSVSLIIVSKR
jgi:hypothetical protein